MDYEDGDIFEVFDVDEWWTFTRRIGDEVADFFSDCKSVDRDDFQQAIDEIWPNLLEKQEYVNANYATNIELTDEQKLLADTDRDGEITESDASRILKYVTKKINEF